MRGKTVVLNGAKVNYDGAVDYSVLAPEVTVYDDTPQELILQRVEGFEVVVTKELPVPGSVLRQFPASVKLLCEAGTGYNNIDLAAAKEKGILVCNVPAYSTQRVAHTAVLLLLCLASGMGTQLRMLEREDRRNFTQHLLAPHTEVNGKTLGVVGAGHIGAAVAALGRALDMQVLVYTRHPGKDEAGLRYVALDELLANSDYVSLHCPLTPETRHLMGRDNLAKMKPGAFLINTARGALVDEAALVEALQSGHLAGAGLDVQEEEPPAGDSPLYAMEHVILTPHMGWKGLETRRRLVEILRVDIQGYLEGKPQNVVSG